MKIKDPVKLKVFNKVENKTYIKDEVYERTVIEQWDTSSGFYGCSVS